MINEELLIQLNEKMDILINLFSVDFIESLFKTIDYNIRLIALALIFKIMFESAFKLQTILKARWE